MIKLSKGLKVLLDAAWYKHLDLQYANAKRRRTNEGYIDFAAGFEACLEALSNETDRRHE